MELGNYPSHNPELHSVDTDLIPLMDVSFFLDTKDYAFVELPSISDDEFDNIHLNPDTIIYTDLDQLAKDISKDGEIEEKYKLLGAFFAENIIDSVPSENNLASELEHNYAPEDKDSNNETKIASEVEYDDASLAIITKYNILAELQRRKMKNEEEYLIHKNKLDRNILLKIIPRNRKKLAKLKAKINYTNSLINLHTSRVN